MTTDWKIDKTRLRTEDNAADKTGTIVKCPLPAGRSFSAGGSTVN